MLGSIIWGFINGTLFGFILGYLFTKKHTTPKNPKENK